MKPKDVVMYYPPIYCTTPFPYSQCFRHLLKQTHPRRGRCSCGSPCSRCLVTGVASTCLCTVHSVVIIQIIWLVINTSHLYDAITQNHLASNDGADYECEEDDEHHKVQDSISPDTSLSKLRLLHRVNWWSDLSAAEELV